MKTPDVNGQLNSNSNARLKSAVKSVEVPPFLEARIRSQIRSQKPRRLWMPLAVTGAAVTAALVAGLGIAYQLGHLRFTAESQESYIVSISTRLVTLMQVGLGDHVHCAFFRKFPKTPPPVEQMESSLGPKYQELAPLVKRHVPAEYRLVLGHMCRYHRRPFIHLSMQGESRLMSLIITAKRDGESFDVEGVLPDLVHSGIPLYTSGADRFQIAAMETDAYLVYFVSDLPAGENVQMMRAMAPELHTFLNGLEG